VGWVEETGGAGSGADTRGESLNFRLRDTGGAYQHVLSSLEMPSRAHEYTTALVIGKQRCGGDCRARTRSEEQATRSVGNNQPHNNMPPYVVLSYCIKE